MGAPIDLAGQAFGRWTVIEKTGQRQGGGVLWLCRCDCGTEQLVTTGHLRSGNSQGCRKCGAKATGLKITKDMTGQRFGRLVVLEQAESRITNRSAYWLCQCDCGNEVVVRGNSLRRGDTKSCGCLGRENRAQSQAARRLLPGEACFRHLFASYKRGAGDRGLVFGLAEKQFRRLTKMPCWYCGAEPAQVKHIEQCHGDYIYNGIDRVDNAKGYTPENCVPCCKTCNARKQASDYNEFLGWVHRVAEHRKLFVPQVSTGDG